MPVVTLEQPKTVGFTVPDVSSVGITPASGIDRPEGQGVVLVVGEGSSLPSPTTRDTDKVQPPMPEPSRKRNAGVWKVAGAFLLAAAVVAGCGGTSGESESVKFGDSAGEGCPAGTTSAGAVTTKYTGPYATHPRVRIRLCKLSSIEGAVVNVDVAERFQKLGAAAKAAGHQLVATSSFRLNDSCQGTGKGRRCAPPGKSAHQIGVALDLNTGGTYKADATCSNPAKGTNANSSWLQRHSKEEYINQYPNEPWHYDALPRCGAPTPPQRTNAPTPHSVSAAPRPSASQSGSSLGVVCGKSFYRDVPDVNAHNKIAVGGIGVADANYGLGRPNLSFAAANGNIRVGESHAGTVKHTTSRVITVASKTITLTARQDLPGSKIHVAVTTACR